MREGKRDYESEDPIPTASLVPSTAHATEHANPLSSRGRSRSRTLEAGDTPPAVFGIASSVVHGSCQPLLCVSWPMRL